MKTEIIGRLEIAGFHNFPEPPKEVEFLTHKHRHTFVVIFTLSAKHDNRDQEIFIVRESVYYFLKNMFGDPMNLGSMSCEHLAKRILETYKENSMVECQVWEEKTGGAKVRL